MQDTAYRIHDKGLGYRIHDAGCKVKDSGFRIQHRLRHIREQG